MQSRARWLVGGAATALIVVGVMAGVIIHVAANRSFDAAAAELGAATNDAGAAARSLGAATRDASGAVTAAEAIVAVAGDALVDVGARSALADAAAASAAAIAAGDLVLQDRVDTPEVVKPFWTWEVVAGTARLDADAADLGELTRVMRGAEDDIAREDELVDAAGMSLFATVPAAAAALEAGSVSAVALVVLDFRDAAEAAAGQDFVASGAVTAFSTYAALAANLQQSAQSELDEKAGTLLATRLEVEEYARSIAGGVVLDFDWRPLVNGLGGDRGLSGTATWNTARGGFSTITLSDSIAQTWPSADARALVTHEVGHSITSKCSTLFDSDDSAANEEWATAWAISMGQTSEGNGVQAYGYPSQSMIDAAAGCR